MKRVITLAASAAILAGCAATPESIAPSYVSEMTYQNYTCQQLAEEQARVQAALATASDQQSKARQNDTVGVIFLGLPVSSLSGQNVASQVANLKGHQEALAKAGNLKNCARPSA